MDNASKKAFKKSAFGGFKREDVVNYIASLSAEHAAEMDKIREELKVAATQNVELKNELSEITAERNELIKKLEDYEQISAALADAKEEIAKLSELKERLEAENSELKISCNKMFSELDAYKIKEQEINKSKERIADLELEARRRVSEAEESARVKMAQDAERQRADMEAQVSEFNAYRDEKYAEVERNISDISKAYQNTKAAVGAFKTGFKGVVADLAREIDTLSEASLAVEEAFASLSETGKEKTE